MGDQTPSTVGAIYGEPSAEEALEPGLDPDHPPIWLFEYR
jgi:hypothetical protein